MSDLQDKFEVKSIDALKAAVRKAIEHVRKSEGGDLMGCLWCGKSVRIRREGARMTAKCESGWGFICSGGVPERAQS